ncbi:enoyl-CoA hydratase-related protein [Bosea sp. (in: a-proteobacteria)]|uniref:enoyl-CoA hydratase/isomerase family protein n=1 Tax=Bosea sp. (in: a-proteobacteria) TaxID=1871050 RepID=UPI0026292480|nr:enoyl-CoA hydratase-related protein [Bosea sp. (in: a-proteobacteria)]MCO5089645.1 enoyl-CoA hydratase-related protein [Bosea sp. (in: a-proteobacteria)]
MAIEVDGALGRLTVRRPNALNALNAAVLEQLLDGVERLVTNPDVRVLQVSGEGERAFIAGADISEFVGARPADALVIAARIKRVLDALARCPKPVVAVINGFCLGGGFELALACDIRIASTKAQFGLPEIKLGILPGGGGTVRLTKMAGSSVARMLTMTGDPISAARAFELGLVASVHEPEQLPGAARALAEKLAALPPFALGQLKSSLNIAVDADTESACHAEVKAFALCYATQDKEEGARAFLEKRKPVFTGR